MPRLLIERFSGLRYVNATQTLHQGRYTAIGREVFASDRELGEFAQTLAQRMGKLALAVTGLKQYAVNKEKARFDFNSFKAENRDDVRLKDITFEEFLDMKQRQVKASAVEIRVAILIMSLIMALAGDWDDDGERDYKKYWITRKMLQTLRRAYSELSFFWNPLELINWLRSPIPVAGLGIDLVRGLNNFQDELMDKVTGRKDSHDKTPFGYYFLDWIPGWNKASSLIEVYAQDKNIER
jgi:hypothetical protein